LIPILGIMKFKYVGIKIERKSTDVLQINGFGTGSFDWTTNDPKNSYVDSQGLHIVPTLTTESTSITAEQLLNGQVQYLFSHPSNRCRYTLNLTRAGGDGSCTADATSSTYAEACSITSNGTSKTIIPPVRSARLTTKGKKNIRYGKIEVVAKLPAGDWLWPAICKFHMPLRRKTADTSRDDAGELFVRHLASQW
jgi:beta-glucanase (GH16 family)